MRKSAVDERMTKYQKSRKHSRGNTLLPVYNGSVKIQALPLTGRKCATIQIGFLFREEGMADFDESKHPRAKDGKFTNGTGNRGYDSRDDFRQTVERAKSASSKNTEIRKFTERKANSFTIR